MIAQSSGFQRMPQHALTLDRKASMRMLLGVAAWLISAVGAGACTRSSLGEQCGDAGRCERVDGCSYNGEHYAAGVSVAADGECD